MPAAIPRIGVPSGAMIIAPITVAVESASTPATAMTPESTSMMKNPLRLAAPSPRERSTASSRSPIDWRWETGISIRVNRDMRSS